MLDTIILAELNNVLYPLFPPMCNASQCYKLLYVRGNTTDCYLRTRLDLY